MNKGKTYQLKTSVTAQDNPDYTIEWDSSDEKVITVDQKGNMVAHAPGEAIITANIGTLSSKIEVTVKAPLQEIILNKNDFSILQGKKEKLVVTYDPVDTTDNKNVIWSSDAPKVVSVDKNGNIQALSEGTAVITAKVGMKTVSTKVTTLVPSVTYSTHVQLIGWQEEVENGEMAGTTGQSKRLEGIKVSLENLPYSGGIEYQTHVQSYGWMSKVNDGTMSGTEGQAKRLEAIRLNLTGEVAKQYDLYYRVHAQSFGWLDWAKNGESAGTEGLAKRLEGIEIILVKKGEKAPENTKRSYVKSKPIVNYSTHVQKQGWQKVVSNGVMSGTSGKALRLEGILMNIYDPSLTGGIEYRTHVEKVGWQDWKADWKMSGTQGKALRLEGIEIKLTEEMAQHYDVYYRVHAQSYGWLGWAKNGESAGTEGLAKRLEGIEVRLVLKSLNAPGSTSNSFIKK
ncbi:Ig-like domain-containing protein [Jeotgalibaca sp. MA1X17-3]|nr:Ig-like domain-containing protein [Jeotgalibaca sp. MA1X17-3]